VYFLIIEFADIMMKATNEPKKPSEGELELRELQEVGCD
jgi:hypothetical protein